MAARRPNYNTPSPPTATPAPIPTPQVGFHDARKVRKSKVERKSNDIVNRLEKTREERSPDLKAEKEVGRPARGSAGGANASGNGS